MATAPLRLGILGSGYMGSTYAECLTRYNSRAKLVAVSGGSRARGLASKYGVEHVEAPEKLLRDERVDAVVVATPPGNHPEHVVQAAEHGKHAMVEKPMAPSSRQCTEMISACERAGVYLEVLQTQRWRSTNAAAKRAITEEKLGRVRMLRGHSLFLNYEGGGAWTKLPEHGGPHLDLNVHGYDMLRFLSGGEPTKMHASVKTFSEDAAPGLSSMAEIAFDNGALAHHWSSQEMPAPGIPNTLFGFVVVGEKGILDIDSYGKVRITDGKEWQTIAEFPKVDYLNKPLDPNRLQPFIAAMQSFIDDVLDGRPPTVRGEDGRKAVEMCEASILSSRSGETVRLPLR